MALRFDGRVVIVTGAGGGLGRTYALDFAKRGASVVVNDLGGEAHGTGASTSMADKVVGEIRAAGGKAVANYDSVEFGDKIVKTAIDNFGRVDVVVNNAGILRDKAFVNMTDEDWDLIHKVHMKGAYSVTRAAWPYMRKEKYGRIINTSSNSGVYGSFGQANYSAAKMGLVGFSNTLALEGAKYNIVANSLVPTAGSRLTQTVMPQDLVDALKPEYVTPLVVFLCHESCTETGKVFEAGAGWFGTIQYYRSKGLALGLASAEDVRDNWSKIVDMSHSQNFASGRDVTAALMEAMSAAPAPKRSPRPAGSTDKMDAELAKSHVPDEPATFTYTTRDAIIYALGIGATTQPEDIKFVYEGAEDFAVFPTFVVAPGLLANGINDWPGVKFDLQRVLHGEQYIEIFKPLPADGELKSHTRVVDIVDKGSGALILANVETYDAHTGEKLAMQQFATFERGFGNFGGARTSAAEKAVVPVPKRSPDAFVEQRTSVDQAALYRQGSGDMNPLHIDSDFAKISGFDRPILHGLCSLGFAVRHVLKQYANNDANRFKAVKVRFSKPVMPGQTLRTEMWKEGDRIHFQTLVKETGETVLSSCYVDLKPGTATGHTHSVKTSSSTTSSNVQSAEIFKEIGERLKSQPDVPKKVQAILLYVIKQGGKDAAQFTVDLKNGAGAVYEGAPKNGEKAATTLTIEDEDFVKLATGKLNPQQAFMSGKIKVKGNIMLLQKLQGLMAAQKAKL